MNNVIKKCDGKGNEIYCKESLGLEIWKEFDKNNNIIHLKTSTGYEFWEEFDKDNRIIYSKGPSEKEKWYKYYKDGERCRISKEEFEEIQFREKQILNKKKVTRFEIMDI